MKLLIVIAALALAGPAAAGLPQHPGSRESTFSSSMVCSRVVFKTSRSVPNRGNIVISASVAGREIQVIGGSGGHTLYLSGRGVLIQVTQDPKHVAPLAVRIASVRPACVRVNILATWG